MKRSAALLLLLILASPAAAEDPVWPLDLGTRYLTSNFMERRPGRWHAGLDLKTDERTGFMVRAVENGWISRVRAESGAYGRAVYLHGESGRTYVFAHLERFNDTIAERIAADRAVTGRYRCRLHFDAGELPVVAGQVLGLSGQSGTVGPHLHFEVRDEHQRPLDPQDWGFAVADTFPPVIRSVTVHGATVSASVGGARILTFSGEALAGTLPPLEVRGAAAFSALITDQSDVRGHVLEPKLIEVSLDGEVVYRCRNDRFAFAENNVQRLEWCHVVDPESRTLLRERWLHRREGVSLVGRDGDLWYLGADGSGLAPGAHTLTIVAEDWSSGRATVTVPLRVLKAEESWGETAWSPLVLQSIVGGSTVPLPFDDPALGAWQVGSHIALSPAAGDPVLAPMVLWTSPRRTAGSNWSASYLAGDWPLDGPLRTDIAGEVPDGAPWVFRNVRQQWKPVGPVLRDDNGAAWFHLTDRGWHAAFVDSVPPVVATDAVTVKHRAARNLPGITLPAWRTVPVAINDEGIATGVDPASIRATLDGAPLIVEPDLIRDRVLVTVPDATESGPHELVIEAADKVGNRVRGVVKMVCGDDH